MPSDVPATKKQPIQSSERSRPAILTSKNLSIVVTGLVLLFAIAKAETKDIPKIVETIFGSNTLAVTGWILAVILLIGNIVSVKLLIKLHDREMDRIAKERDDLQMKLISQKGE